MKGKNEKKKTVKRPIEPDYSDDQLGENTYDEYEEYETSRRERKR
jgi:hypothetical protein